MPHALLIDDNPTNLEVLAQMLKMEGVSSTLVTDPSTLESVLAGVPNPDLIFVDLEMPALNGFQVLNRLNNMPHLSGIPVIAHTVHLSQINEARAYGFHSFIGKPLNFDKFPKQLHDLLKKQPIWVIS